MSIDTDEQAARQALRAAALLAPPEPAPSEQITRRVARSRAVLALAAAAVAVVAGVAIPLVLAGRDGKPAVSSPAVTPAGPRLLPTPVDLREVHASAPAPCLLGWVAEPDTGTCLQVGRSLLHLTQVESVTRVVPDPGGMTIRIRVLPADRAALDAAIRQTVGNQLAVVAGTTVLSAPQVNERITGGSVDIVGGDTASAEALLRALGG